MTGGHAALEVVVLGDVRHPEDSDCAPRGPHRHDYHELIWSRRGAGSHLIDGRRSPSRPGSVTLIGRGQIHVFEHAAGLQGALVRFGDEVLQHAANARRDPSWLVGFGGPQVVLVPEGDVERLDALIGSLCEEARRSQDAVSVDVQRHLLHTLLPWLARWHDSTSTAHRDRSEAALQLYAEFVMLLELDFARRHEASEYADELAVPQAVLSRARAEVTGRRTKELITDRRMLEAARQLRYTDCAVGEVASLAGFTDQLYFSRAFKRYYGESPSRYRNHARGR